jgi:hypothetical protein
MSDIFSRLSIPTANPQSLFGSGFLSTRALTCAWHTTDIKALVCRKRRGEPLGVNANEIVGRGTPGATCPTCLVDAGGMVFYRKKIFIKV